MHALIKKYTLHIILNTYVEINVYESILKNLPVHTGILSRFYKNIPNVHEIECFGENTQSEAAKLISLKLYRLPEKAVVASLNMFTGTCMTSELYVSCDISEKSDSKSWLKALIQSDLSLGNSPEFTCTVNIITSEGDSILHEWKMSLERYSMNRLSFYKY